MMVPPPGGAKLSPALLPAGAKPLAKPKPAFGKKPGKPQQGKKPGNWPWWKPWYPHAGYWSDWAPAWWTGWGVVNADMTYVDALPYVVVWIDRCSPEWAQAFAAGTAQLPTEYDGLPVIVRYTCGNLAEMEDVPGTPAYGAVETQLNWKRVAVWAAVGGAFGLAFGEPRLGGGSPRLSRPMAAIAGAMITGILAYVVELQDRAIAADV
jgi:hypothetical protein